MKKYLTMLFLVGICSSSFAQISYSLEVEQMVENGELVLDFIVDRPAGSTPFAFGSSNFSVYVNSAALNIPGMYKDAAYDGPWDNNTNSTNYYDLSVGHNNSNYVNMNINYIVGSPGSGSPVPVGRTRIGRIRIPITDSTQCNNIVWRIPPLAINQHDGTSIKSYANFVNSTFCLPLCSQPPVITASSTGPTGACEGETAVFTTQNTSTCILLSQTGTANAQITSLDTSNHAILFSGAGQVTLRFLSANGCNKDTTLPVNPRPQLLSFSPLCSDSTVEFIGDSNDLDWYITYYDTTLSFSDTLQADSSHFRTQITGHGIFVLTLESSSTYCLWDTVIEVLPPVQWAQPSPVILCAGDTFTVHLNRGISSAQWFFPSSLSVLSGGTSVDSFGVFVASLSGLDTLQVTGIDAKGCPFSLEYFVSIDTVMPPLHLTQATDSLSNVILVANYTPYAWYRNDTLIGGPHDTLWVTQPGDYYAVYSNACGTYYSDTITVILTAKGLITEHYGWKLYPNPNSGSFYVELPAEKLYTFRIYDGTGKLIYQGSFYGTKYWVQLKEITEGVYTLEVEGVGYKRWIYKR